MKVAHLNCVYEYGSTGKLIKEIVDEGQKYGIESKVFYSELQAEDERGVRYITDIERNVHAVLSRITGLQGYWSKNATKRLLKEIKDFNPDVIHIHTLHGNSINLPKLFHFLNKEELPVVLTLHDCWWFTGRCAHPLAYECDKWENNQKEHCLSCLAKQDVCPSWFFDKANSMLEDKKKWFESLSNLYVVCVSNWLENQVRRSYVFENSEQILSIYNWIDLDVFRVSEKVFNSNKLPAEKKIVLGVASIWSESKGLADFIWLSQNLSNEYQVVLVGNLQQEETLPENIIHIPNTNNQHELASLYNRADVFVNPSRFESFGLTTVEAMACGTPVVVYEFSTSREIVGDNCGAVVAPGEKAQLLNAIMDVCNRKKESFVCRDWVTERFSKKNGIAKYVEIYEKSQRTRL